MIAISLRFLAGRYHATPWGRHVNEGVVEWPPSPWRLLRALVATWKRTLPDVEQEEVEPILRELARPPEYRLPPASTGHSRHYVPLFRGSPTLIFDTFVALSPEAPLVVQWPDVTLERAETETLARILRNLTTLGRAESWCEAGLVEDETALAETLCRPLNGEESAARGEIVRLLCADPETAFSNDRFTVTTVSRSGRKTNRKTATYDPDWHLCAETLWLDKQKWSDPPGSRWVPYVRPRDSFRVNPRLSRRRQTAERRIHVVRFALDSTVLPLVTETLPFADGARRAAMSWYGRLTARDGVRGRSTILSGKDADGEPLQGHRHAYYLPTDEDGDGRLDHLTLYAAAGFGPDEIRAFDRLREIRIGWEEEPYPVRVLLIGMGTLEEYRPGPLTTAREWVSATPYIATRHAKTRGKHAVDRTSPDAKSAFLIDNLREQIGHARPDLPETTRAHLAITPLWDENGVFHVESGETTWRTIQFKRSRRRARDDGDRRFAGAFRLTFDEPVPGPFLIGWNAHFGMGLFLPAEENR